MLFSFHSTVLNGLKISEYEAYQLTEYTLINSWAHAKE